MNTAAAAPDGTKADAPDALRGRWTIGLTIIGGSIFGLMFDWEALYPALTHRMFHYGSHGDIAMLGELIGGYVLPLVVVFLAPRKSFIWAAAALGVGLVWSLMDRIVTLNDPGLLSDLKDNGAAALVTLIVLCSPISLVRLLLRRRHDGKLRRIAAQQAWMQQASQAQAGVWPPPIQTPEQN